MGQAKRRTQEREKHSERIGVIDFARVASAIRRLATATSARHGSDCYVHAALAQAVLARLGVSSQITIGFCAFRVGEGDSDVVAHAPLAGMVYQEDAIPYHAWLNLGGNIFDTTTYAIRSKAAELDRLDGGHTDVIWCPDYLFVPLDTVSTMKDVAKCHAGMYYYERVLDLEEKIKRISEPLDAGDIETAWLLYQTPDMMVIGPNDMLRLVL